VILRVIGRYLFVSLFVWVEGLKEEENGKTALYVGLLNAYALLSALFGGRKAKCFELGTVSLVRIRR
jgi:hypothetical protein